MAPDGVLQKVVASLRSVGEFDLSAVTVTPSSSVYKAVERKLRRPLIIKLMPLSQWANCAQIGAMANAERRIVKGFDFPNIPRLLTGGEIDDHLFWITEFVDGIPLSRTIESGEIFSALDIVDMARQLCNSVESTSRSGIVHHRFVPRNLIIEWDGGAKILDWGAPPYADLGAKTCAATLSAAHYLAPEQLGDAIGDLRSNLFSVGVMLYQLATGHLPFSGETVAALKATMSGGNLKSPSQWNAKIPAGISAPILKALSQNPDDRYQGASEFIRDLENFKKYGVKEELPANFYAQKSTAPNSEPSLSRAPRQQVDSGLEFDNAWTPAITAKQSDVASMSLQDSSVAVAEKPPEPVVVPVESPAPAKETVYCEPEEKPAAPPKPRIPIPKIKPPKVTMKDVNRVANKVPPLTAALVLAGIVVVFFAWKFIIPSLITKDAPATEVAAQNNASQPAQAPVAQPVQDQPVEAPAVQEAAPEPDVVVRTFDKSGKSRTVRKGRNKTVVLPAPVVPTVGELSVNSDPPGVPFQMDGRTDASFVTPATIGQLSPGRHVVTFAKSGYQAQSLATEVVAGSRATVMTRLALQGGTLNIGSRPSGAKIFIDGRDTGKTTPAQFIVAHGQHTLALKLPGYLEATTPVTMADGENRSVVPEMIAMGRTVDIKTTKKGLFGLGARGDKDMGKVNIRTNPSGAIVLVNGQSAPKATPLEFSLNPGGYELTFQLHGYKTKKKVIVVDSGSKLMIDESLEME